MITNTKTRKPPGPSLLHQYGFLFLFLFFILVLWAFWSSYYQTIFSPHPTAIRLHGTAMTLWCLMLIGQAFLVRWKKLRLHKRIGIMSYGLVPFILWSGAHLAYITIHQAPQRSYDYYYMIALMYNSLIVFAILYGLAIFYRKKSAIHARYMVSTIFPIITPVTDRLIYKYFDALVALAPTTPEGMPLVPIFGFALADLILMLLIIIDWKKHRRLSVFPFVLGLLVLYQLSVLIFYRHHVWHSMADVMMRIPF